MWKGGSELQFTTSFRVNPVDPVDPVACAKLVFRLDETLLCPPEACPGPGLARSEQQLLPPLPEDKLDIASFY